MTARRIGLGALWCALYTAAANGYFLAEKAPAVWAAIVAAALAVNLFAGFDDGRIPTTALKFCRHGTVCLILFAVTAPLAVGWHIWLWFQWLPDRVWPFVFSALLAVALEAALFWNGIISVYATSVQLGIRRRVIGLICGPVPIAHLIALGMIVAVCRREVREETEKEQLNRSRRDERICATRYPLLLVHGVFFRDFKRLNYWGRIPAELERNGAVVFYGEHSSALSVAGSAAELRQRIETICRQTGCEKVNVIAHSKGGLDVRRAMADGVADRVASLTTINTPHRGCGFADYLLGKIPDGAQRQVARGYNAAAKRLGDPAPDFLAAVGDLTAAFCNEFDRAYPPPEGVFCQSVGSRLNRPTGGKFPLNFTHTLVRHFDGPNDGLVAADSFAWGERYRFLEPAGRRGISHGDMIDLNRENIPGFDVREFYVALVADLKARGL
ncbi:MAG: esterase/lipase family protein [Acutalibacteraceae bacterium]|jgi:triacylglycerol lipase